MNIQPAAPSGSSNTFECIKRVASQGHEYWTARDLARTLDYSEFRHFLPVIAKAQEACTQSGHKAADHFEQILDMVDIGSGARRQVEDWALPA